MDTAVALAGAYLRVNGYVAIPEQPILIGEGRPWRYHTATDVDLLAVRFPRAAVVVPRNESGRSRPEDDLQLAVDPLLGLKGGAVDVIIAEVKESRPRLNPALREPDVLYATLRRIDPGFDAPIEGAVEQLIERGDTTCPAGGRRWRFRLVAFGVGDPIHEGGPFAVIDLGHAARFLVQLIGRHRKVWNDAQFGDAVLDLFHLLDKVGLFTAPAGHHAANLENAAGSLKEIGRAHV